MNADDYKKIIIELVKRINDLRLLESIYYIIQKLGRGF